MDNNQFMPDQGAPIPTAPASSASVGKIIIIIIGIAIIGGGAYYLFSGGSFLNQSSNNMSSSKSSGEFSCKDLLPDSKFQEITGISDFMPLEEGRDRTVEGLNLLPGNEGAGDLAVEAGIQQLICGYAFTESSKQSVSYAGAVAGDIAFGIVWGGVGAEEAFRVEKDAITKIASEGASYAGIDIPPDKESLPVDVFGIGSAAYLQKGDLTFVSSNKKYLVSFHSTNNAVDDLKRIQEEMAIVIDANLK